MLSDDDLFEAVRRSAVPAALLDASGQVRAASPDFRPLGTAWVGEGLQALGDREVFSLQVGPWRLVLELPSFDAAREVDELSSAVREAAVAVRQRGEELARARYELALLTLLEAIERTFPEVDDEGLGRVAAMVSPRLGGRGLHFTVSSPMASARSGVEPSVAAEAVFVVREGVRAEAKVQGPLADGEAALLRAVVEQLAACGVRAELRAQRLAREAVDERERLTSLLMHEANSPLAVTVANLSFALERLKGASPEVVDALHDAQEQARRVGKILRQLRASNGIEGMERIDTARLVRAFDARRSAATRPAPDGASVIGVPAVVLPALELFGQHLAEAQAIAGVNGEGLVIRVVGGASTPLPPELVQLGARWEAVGHDQVLLIPFRLVPTTGP